MKARSGRFDDMLEPCQWRRLLRAVQALGRRSPPCAAKGSLRPAVLALRRCARAASVLRLTARPAASSCSAVPLRSSHAENTTENT
jgi:hypothetical protein